MGGTGSGHKALGFPFVSDFTLYHGVESSAQGTTATTGHPPYHKRKACRYRKPCGKSIILPLQPARKLNQWRQDDRIERRDAESLRHLASRELQMLVDRLIRMRSFTDAQIAQLPDAVVAYMLASDDTKAEEDQETNSADEEAEAALGECVAHNEAAGDTETLVAAADTFTFGDAGLLRSASLSPPVFELPNLPDLTSTRIFKQDPNLVPYAMSSHHDRLYCGRVLHVVAHIAETAHIFGEFRLINIGGPSFVKRVAVGAATELPRREPKGTETIARKDSARPLAT
ncbi:hypothetical protein K474DRAFT_1680957 [Panus rudis PR-1116 ss-1]|nr:hypothetical protein K474DRAFT_1680957 [Panus rudis PR-1116 ss-1]